MYVFYSVGNYDTQGTLYHGENVIAFNDNAGDVFRIMLVDSDTFAPVCTLWQNDLREQ